MRYRETQMTEDRRTVPQPGDRPGDPVARVLIVDDESPAREELRFLLSEIEGVAVVGSATTAEEAQALIDSIEYDVVLLDVRMPGIGGLELAARLRGRDPRPAVIFTTAYAAHAVEAFDLEAVDYLVKPFDGQRLRRALDRALEARPSRRAPTHAEGESAPAPSLQDGEDTRRAEVPGRIPVHKGDRVILVGERQVIYARAVRGYAQLKVADERLLASFSLNDLEERLSSDFARTHRSYLVNLRYVREVVSSVGGALELVMADQGRSRVPVARRQAAEVRRRLGM